MNVFLFYRTDNWNSHDSKDLVYIGTNKEASIKIGERAYHKGTG